jgi:cytoskeletal protein CcmA (bactofilin family)
MAIGRISGPLLKANLVRDGVDLAFETDLLYLDVTNARIGINTVSPQADLDVNGTVKSLDLRIDDQAIIADISISGNNIISTTGTIDFTASGGDPTVYHSRLIVDDFLIQGNTISTTVSNSPIELRANGTGTVELQANTNITGDLYVTGDISADGDITIGGNVIVGDQNTDTITLNAKIASDIIPETDITYDIGSGSRRWRDLYINRVFASTEININDLTISGNTISTTASAVTFNTPPNQSVIFNSRLLVDDISIEGNKISTVVSNSPLELEASGTGKIEILSDTDINGSILVYGDFTTNGSVSIAGNTTIGNSNSDLLTINSRINSSLIPTTDITYDLGSAANKWRDLYVNRGFVTNQLILGNFTISGNTISTTASAVTFNTPPNQSVIFNSRLLVDDIRIEGNKISTVVSNSPLELEASGTGKVEILSDTEIFGDLDVNGDVNVTGNVVIGGNIIIGDESTDTITINASIESDLIPRVDNQYDLGSPSFRWKDIYVNDFFTTALNIPALDIGDLEFRDNEITSVNNQDIIINAAGTGAVRLGNFRFASNTITNTVSGAISVIAQTGTGYFKIGTTNGFVPPVGNNAQRPTAYAVVGMTRYNTVSRALEIWDGLAWASPAGASGAVSVTAAEDIAAIYALTLG